MTQSNDSFQKTADGSGPLIATHAPGDGKEYQVVALADEGGHLKRTRETYRLFVPSSAVGANKVFFDLFNATGSGLTLRLLGVFAVPNLDTAVTGTLAVRLFLTRTTAVGTGGTGATADGSALNAATFTRHNPSGAALHANVTARLAPGGGATAGAVLGEVQYDPEETRTNGYFAQVVNMAQRLPFDEAPILIPENTGIRVVQGSVASVGSVGFLVVFET